MLRAVSDGVMLGAGTMNAEADYTCHVFDQDMEDMRIANGKNPVPWNIVTSLDATDIPFDHILFRSPEVPVMISTSRKGAALVKVVETPSYMHYLVSQKMMDELFFNYSCIYVGGQALTIGKFGKEFTSQDHPHTRMLSIHTHSDHFFYLRHKLLYD